MAVLSPPAPHTPSRTAHGIGCVIVGMLFFVGQDVLMKTLLGNWTIWVLMSVRACMAVIVLVPLILMLGHPHRLVSPNWRLHLLRAVLFTTGFALFYSAFPFMGLAEVSTIFFSAPLMITLMAALFLRESIGVHRIGALVTGFAGVVIAMRPGAEGLAWIALLPLACAAFYAASQVLARRIGDGESSLTVGLWTLVFSAPLALAMGWAVNRVVTFGPEFAHLRWTLPEVTAHSLPPVLLLGIVGMVGYTLLSRAYQVADASAVAPFDYSYLPMASVAAWLLWSEIPPVGTLIGMALIVASGLYIAWREMHGAGNADSQAVVAETITAPVNPFAPTGEGSEAEDAARAPDTAQTP
ncbi:MAG: DMT family transporter [Roseovarius sp.]